MTRELSDYLESKITPRIARLSSFVAEGRSTWDLCCDHGLIGLYAWSRFNLPDLHFVDRAPNVVARLEAALQGRMNLDSIFFHPMDASELELPSRPCNVIIAGVGFRAMKRIIEANYPTSLPHRVIISIHTEEERVAQTMTDLGWRLHGTAGVEERGRMRLISAWNGGGAVLEKT